VCAIEAVDCVLELDGLAHLVSEDGSKFVGIFASAVFHIRAAWLTTCASAQPKSSAVRSEGAPESAPESLQHSPIASAPGALQRRPIS